MQSQLNISIIIKIVKGHPQQQHAGSAKTSPQLDRVIPRFSASCEKHTLPIAYALIKAHIGSINSPIETSHTALFLNVFED